MPYEEAAALPERPHALTLESRERLNLSGVQDVSGFDENLVVLSTALGALTVKGRELHIEKIDLEKGELSLRGRVQELSYDEPPAGGSLWSRLFG